LWAQNPHVGVLDSAEIVKLMHKSMNHAEKRKPSPTKATSRW